VTAYLLALASAALYGGADFLGGLASRRASTIAVVLVSQGAGIVPLALLVVIFEAAPSTQDFFWGAAAGLAGGVGVALLYRALAVGTMSIVAPTTAVCAVMLPVAAEAVAGERLPAVTQIGIALAVVAIVLVSQQDAGAAASGRPGRRLLPAGIVLALASGVAIGVFFLALARTGATAGLWPLLPARGVSLVVFGILAATRTGSLRLERPALTTAGACGVVDMLANALYLLASRGGPLSVVVTLASLYPASTVVLARFVIGERLSRLQGLGIACALVAVVMIVSTS
jgi:drug/metabolite transporter (DMT)-like permease